ncbi:hypothetical protein NDU88_004345 [Pleurodeles waltl]|uniref:Uncharacterized protein n=1 Tax=Pleurodeles waltl TaxID=8319 RepID=A0AAV7WVA0_PLEWA|nr:hypothetical protein NDU88_004345 [Pleurodeles waltl]
MKVERYAPNAPDGPSRRIPAYSLALAWPREGPQAAGQGYWQPTTIADNKQMQGPRNRSCGRGKSERGGARHHNSYALT